MGRTISTGEASSPPARSERRPARRGLGSDPGVHRADLELVRAALARHASAVDALIGRLRCIPLILAAKNARLGSRLHEQDLDDVTQDVLAVVWRKLADFGGLAALESWVYPFCVLELMNAVRRKERSQRVSRGLPATLAEEGATTRPTTLDFEPLYRGLARLPSPQSNAIRMRYFEHLSFEEVSERLGVPLGTAKSHFYRGMERLRTILRPLRRECSP